MLLSKQLPRLLHQRQRIYTLHRLPKRRRHLDKIGTALNIQRLVLARSVEESRRKEQGIAFLQRQRNVSLQKVLIELLPPVRHETRPKPLAKRQQPRRPTLQRHVRMRNRPLQRKQPTRIVHRLRPPRHIPLRLEPEVVIPMADLRLPARLHDIQLRRDPVRGAQVCFADEAEERVGVVFDEGFRVLKAVFRKRVPDPAISRSRREVVPFGSIRFSQFSFDDCCKSRVGAVQHVHIREEVLQNIHSRSIVEHVEELVSQGFHAFVVLEIEVQGIVDRHVLLNFRGERVG